ncbi:MAG: NAD kinase [Prevotellaceae bacterium]|nr:NAD kinase [Prevotellaceae bacterium]
MKKHRFALFGNIYQAKKSVPIQKLLCTMEMYGAEVYLDRRFYEYLTEHLQLDVRAAGLIEGNDFSADTVISMGGDGTFLEVASRVRDKGIPILGINTGHLGFLAGVAPDEIEQAIAHVIDGNCMRELHSVLQLEYEGGTPKGYPYALNEVAVLKRDNSSMISIRVDINGEYLTTYQADGLIVNTPTGSTGYALSVGGPIMAQQSGTIGLIAVAPHSLNVRPLTLPDNAELQLTVESRSHHFLVAVDGRSEACQEGVKLTLRRAPYDICVLKRPGYSFFRTLRQKLMMGNDLRVEGAHEA